MLTDEEAVALYEETRPTELYGTPIPDAWIGPGALDEFRDGRGDDDD